MQSQTVDNPDGTHTYYAWDKPTSQFTWSSYWINYDSQWRATNKTVNNDNGTHSLFEWDVNNQVAWTTRSGHYSSNGVLTDQTVNNDDGTRTFFVWDQANAPWTNYWINYDSQGHRLNKTVNNDNGTHTYFSWDAAGALKFYANYTSNWVMTDQTVNNANGTHTYFAYDVNQQQSWSNYFANYDVQGRVTDKTFNNDNGTHTYFQWDVTDQQSWSNFHAHYNAQWQVIDKMTNNDDGTSSFTVWDVNNQNSWSSQQTTYDTSGQRTGKTINNDEGSRIDFGWDVPDQFSWTRFIVEHNVRGRLQESTFFNDDGTQTHVVGDPTNSEGWVFSVAELNTITTNPQTVLDLYNQDRAKFLALLPASFANLPEDYIKLAFCGILAYELKPYGNSSALTFHDLLADTHLQCSSYAQLTNFLYKSLGSTGLCNVAQVGWDGSPCGNHAEMMISAAGYDALLVDPTIALLALTGGYNALTAGIPVAADHQISFYKPLVGSDPFNLNAFNNNIVAQVSNGGFGGHNLLYWIDPSDFLHYGSALMGTPEAPFVQGTPPIPTDSAPDTTGVSLTTTAVAGGFFTTAELNSILAHPDQIGALYAADRSAFMAKLSSGFAGAPEDYIKLAFSTVLAYELKPFGSSGATSLHDLLNSAALGSVDYALLSWRLYQVLQPDSVSAHPNSDVDMVFWNGGSIGNQAHLIIQAAGAGHALIINPTVADMALVGSFDDLVAGAQVTAHDLTSFFSRPGMEGTHISTMSDFSEGLFRTGNVMGWFETIAQYAELVPHTTIWGAPQDQPYLMANQQQLSGIDLLLSALPVESTPLPTSFDSVVPGTPGDDQLQGAAGSDHLIGGNGNDHLDGGTGADWMEGGLGNDTFVVNSPGDRVTDTGGIDSVIAYTSYILPASIENLTLAGTAALDGAGNAAANILTGNDGNNRLWGGAGNDTLIGGAGADTLTGGTGQDKFVYLALTDSTPAPAGRDTILDLSLSEGDKIDLSALDANATLSGKQSFVFIDNAAFTAAGQVHWVADPNGGVLLEANVDLNLSADFAIRLLNVSAIFSSNLIL